MATSAVTDQELQRAGLSGKAAASGIEHRCGTNDGAEVLPGATRQEVTDAMMQDLVGDYEVPDQVPEWAWVERNASYAHVDNGKEEGGVWEFILYLGKHWADIPESLRPTIQQARDRGFTYLIFHQGT